MEIDFTLLLLMQHYPFTQQLHVFSNKDLIMDADVADCLQTTEQQVSKCVLDHVYAYASASVQH